MNYPEPNDVYYAAEQLLPYLENEMRQNLSVLIERSKKGDKVDDLIINLLSENEATHQWMRSALFGEQSGTERRGYQPAAGNPGSVGAQKWFCPKCSFTWRINRAGQPIPPCPKDGLALAPEKGR